MPKGSGPFDLEPPVGWSLRLLPRSRGGEVLAPAGTQTERFRPAAVTTGVLFIVATAASVAGSALSGPVLDRTDYLASLSGDANRVDAGLLLQIIAAGASVGIALAMYPVLRTWGRGLSLGSVVFRTIEALLYIVAVVSALSLLGVAQRFLGADAAQRASFQAVGDSLLDVRRSGQPRRGDGLQRGGTDVLLPALPFPARAPLAVWLGVTSRSSSRSWRVCLPCSTIIHHDIRVPPAPDQAQESSWPCR